MKKFILFVFSLIIGLAVFCGLNVKATAGLDMTTGAQIRADGEFQGLRFEAAVDSLEGAIEHGFYLAAGEHTLSAMTTAIGANALTVGSNKLVKVPAGGDDTSFAVTVYGMDELSEYVQDITAIAYVKTAGGFEYDEVVIMKIKKDNNKSYNKNKIQN